MPFQYHQLIDITILKTPKYQFTDVLNIRFNLCMYKCAAGPYVTLPSVFYVIVINTYYSRRCHMHYPQVPLKINKHCTECEWLCKSKVIRYSSLRKLFNFDCGGSPGGDCSSLSKYIFSSCTQECNISNMLCIQYKKFAIDVWKLEFIVIE